MLKVAAMPDVAKRVRETLFSEPGTLSPAGFRALIEQEITKWRAFGKGIKLGN